jgi:hypothetical protein
MRRVASSMTTIDERLVTPSLVARFSNTSKYQLPGILYRPTSTAIDAKNIAYELGNRPISE